MFKILHKTFKTGIVTSGYPDRRPSVSEHFRGAPEFEFDRWTDARPAVEACPTGAISAQDDGQVRWVTVDYGRCIFCGQCAAASGDGIHMTRRFELAARSRDELVRTAEYTLDTAGFHTERLGIHNPEDSMIPASERPEETPETFIRRLLGRSLAIREVDAGSCNGCELEIGALNNPVYDIERFGAHFVASPRHADMLLVTGPVTRNMELALRKTYAATPDPKVVIAVGACGTSGGIFGRNYATLGGVDTVIPVDVYVAGCPPRPEALLHAILTGAKVLSEKFRASDRS